MWVSRIAVAAFLVCSAAVAANLTTTTNSTTSTTTPTPPQCSTANDCNHGVCNNSTNMCICSRGYLTATGQPPCSYQQKSSVIAGVVEFIFPGFGFGQMYLHNWGLGFGKFAVNVVLGTLIAVPFLTNTNTKLGTFLNSWCSGLLWSAAVIGTGCAQIAWWLHDGVVIVQGQYVGIVGQRNTWHWEPYRDGYGYYVDGCTACPN